MAHDLIVPQQTISILFPSVPAAEIGYCRPEHVSFSYHLPFPGKPLRVACNFSHLITAFDESESGSGCEGITIPSGTLE